MATRDIESSEFGERVLKSDKYILVDFWAPWCGPCRLMSPILEELSEDIDLKEKLKVVKVNIEEPENQPLAMLYGVQGIPNMKLFHKGKLVNDFVGLRPKEVFRRELMQVISE
jgi:thioredoxin 1